MLALRYLRISITYIYLFIHKSGSAFFSKNPKSGLLKDKFILKIGQGSETPYLKWALKHQYLEHQYYIYLFIHSQIQYTWKSFTTIIKPLIGQRAVFWEYLIFYLRVQIALRTYYTSITYASVIQSITHSQAYNPKGHLLTHLILGLCPCFASEFRLEYLALNDILT